MKLRLISFLLFLLLENLVREANTLESLNASDILETIKQIANQGLFVQQMQEIFDSKTTFRQSTTDGPELLNQIVQSVNSKFGTVMTMLRELQQLIQTEYENFPTIPGMFEECCFAFQKYILKYDARFKQLIGRQNLCVRKSRYAKNFGSKFATRKIMEKMRENLERSDSIRWQFYGSQEGIMEQYPVSATKDCHNFDPVFRPWYVGTASPVRKDVVIVLDRSSSMSYISKDNSAGHKAPIDIARESVHTVLDTLTPKDRVSVVAFSTHAELPISTENPSGCYRNQLALATPQNVQYIKSFVSNIKTYGSSDFIAGLTAGFSLFQHSHLAALEDERAQVIILLTDGSPTNTEQEVLNFMSSSLTSLDHKVTVMTFGIGSYLSSFGEQLLEKMTKVNTAQPGKFMHIANDTSVLKREIGKYYSHLDLGGHSTKPVLSQPYVDALGLGLVTTVSLPVITEQYGFVGVVGMDLSVPELLKDVLELHDDRRSYAFIIDQEGHTYSHPLLPDLIFDSDTFMLDIGDLETNDKVITNMKLGKSGAETGIHKYVSPSGDIQRDGVLTQSIKTDYLYQQLTIEGTSLAVCLVHPAGDRAVSFTLTDDIKASFVHHRLDLQPDLDTCTYYKRVAFKDRSSVMFAAHAFHKPQEYLNKIETLSDISKYTNETVGLAEAEHFKEDVGPVVKVTAVLDELWVESAEKAKYAVWRYFGWSNGVVRVFPGNRLHHKYDPTNRPWYRKAALMPDKYTLSPPYLDGFGAGYVITLSKAVTNSLDGTAVGVMGLDMSATYLFYLVETIYPVCLGQDYRCMVMDTSGYLVAHPSFISSYGPENPVVENIHITVKEPELASDLVRKGVMKQSACVGTQRMQHHYQYQISIVGSLDNSAGTPAYRVDPVPYTNIIIIILDNRVGSDGLFVSGDTCPCSEPWSSSPPVCQSEHTSPCECPCSQKANFNYCQNKFSEPHPWPLCPPEVTSLNMTVIYMEEFPLLPDLPKCYEENCHTLLTEGDCLSAAQCSWCRADINGNQLSTPRCDVQDECYFGQAGYEDLYSSLFNIHLEAEESMLVSVLCIVGGAIAVIVLSIIGYYGQFKKQQAVEEQARQARAAMKAVYWQNALHNTPTIFGPIPYQEEQGPMFSNMQAQSSGVLHGVPPGGGTGKHDKYGSIYQASVNSDQFPLQAGSSSQTNSAADRLKQH